MANRERALLAGALFVSGAASLTFEVVWIRTLSMVFGSTILSLSIVTAVFFLGMTAGARIAAVVAPRLRSPIVLFALLELGVGIYALLSYPLLERAHFIYSFAGAHHSPALLLSLKGVVTAAILLLPTLSMGATLPLLVRASQGGARAGLRTATLYGANTFGAVAGCLLSGLWWIGAVGLNGTLWCGAGLDLLAVCTVLALLRVGPTRERSRRREAEPRSSPPEKVPALLLWIAAVGGCVGMCLELTFARTLHLLLMGTIETVSAVLAAFLFGLALGSIVYRFLAARGRIPADGVALLLVATAVFAALACLYLEPVGFVAGWLADRGGAAAALLRFGVAAMVLVPPAVASGALFPALVDSVDGAEGGGAVGRLLAANTLGSVVGSFATAVLLLPGMGSSATIYLAVILLLGTALLSAFRARRRRAAAAAVVVALLMSTLWPGVNLPRLALMLGLRANTYRETQARLDRGVEKLLFSAEGAHGVVTLSETDPGVYRLAIDSLPQAGTYLRARPYPQESVLLGALPAVLARGSDRALVIGLGGGITADSLVAAGVKQVEVVELEPRVAEAMRHQPRLRRCPLDDPRISLIHDDGRDFLLRRGYLEEPVRYDVIASQPTHWWLSGVGSLATVEFYRLAHHGLAEGGVYLQWINVSRMTEEVLRGVIGAMEQVFEQTLVLVADEPGLVYIAGVRGSLALDAAVVASRLQRRELRSLTDGLPRSLAEVLSWVAFSGKVVPGAPRPSNRDRDALVETRLARVSASASVDVGALMPPLLEHVGLPREQNPLDDGEYATLLVETVERRLNTPGGEPRLVLDGLDGAVPFGPVRLSLARKAATEASLVVDPCWSRYLFARISLAENLLDEARVQLGGVCADHPDHPAAQRAARFAALLDLDLERCVSGLLVIERARERSPLVSYLTGALRFCLDQDPAADYRAAISGWRGSGLPGGALLWAVQRGEALPDPLLGRMRREAPVELVTLRARLALDADHTDAAEAAEMARRLAGRVRDKQRMLREGITQLEREGQIARARQRLDRLVATSPRDPAVAMELVRFHQRQGEGELAAREVRAFLDRVEDPAARYRMLGLAKESGLELNDPSMPR